MSEQFRLDFLGQHVTKKSHPVQTSSYDPTKFRCDICGKPATRWFLDTSAVACDSSECYQIHQDRYDESLKCYEDIEND